MTEAHTLFGVVTTNIDETTDVRRVVDPDDGSWRRCTECFTHRINDPRFATPWGDIDGVAHLVPAATSYTMCGVRTNMRL